MEFIGLIATVLGLIIAWLAYKKQFLSKPKEELDHLKVQFKATQKLSLKVRQQVEQLINDYGYGDRDIFQNMKYNTYLYSMKDSYEYNLSDSLFAEIDKLKLTKSNIASMTKSLENQFEALLLIDTQLRVTLNELQS